MTVRATPAAGRELGGYELLYALKTGGMGEVLLARKVGAGGFEKLVAIKTIRPEYRERDEVRQMFFDEARLAARINHAAVAQVYDFGEHEGELYLAMEYVEGIRFRGLAAMQPEPGIAARAMAAALRGLHAAHELTDLSGTPLEVVHRDITPENLMLAFDGQVKVLDFGIALVRGRQAPVTELGTIKGKPPYLSPEQLRGEALDRRTDVFSAAIVMHELLTGEPLFYADSVYAVARMIEHEDVAPPSATRGPLPDGLDDAVMQALSRDPAERFQTAEAFAAALEAVADKADTEQLPGFARRALAAELDEHRAWLRGVLSEVDSALADRGARGRASGVMTAPADEAIAAALSERAGAEAAAVAEAEPESVAVAEAGRRGGWWIAVAAIALVTGAAVWLATRDAGEPTRTAAIEVADAAPMADAAPVAVAPADAAPVLVAIADASTPTALRPREPRRPRPKPDAAVVRPRDPPPPATATTFGLLTVAAEPYALVRIDGKEIGATPILRRRIATGSHEVVLVNPDSGTVRLTRTIQVDEGKLVRIVDR